MEKAQQHDGLWGRNQEVEALTAMLHDAPTVRVTVMGPPGVGKTSLARVLCGVEGVWCDPRKSNWSAPVVKANIYLGIHSAPPHHTHPHTPTHRTPPTPHATHLFIKATKIECRRILYQFFLTYIASLKLSDFVRFKKG